jgi:hypothetical protein
VSSARESRHIAAHSRPLPPPLCLSCNAKKKEEEEEEEEEEK